MAQDGALVLALDGEVDAFAEAGAVDCCLAHVGECEYCNGLVKMVHVGSKRLAMESIIIIDHNSSGSASAQTCDLGGETTKGTECKIIVILKQLPTPIDLAQSTTMRIPCRYASRRLSIVRSNQVP